METLNASKKNVSFSNGPMVMLSDAKRNVEVLIMIFLHNIFLYVRWIRCESEVWVCHSDAHSSFPTLMELEYYKHSCEIFGPKWSTNSGRAEELLIVAGAVRYKLIKKAAATKCCRSQFVI